MFLGSLSTDVGIAPCAKTAREIASDVELDIRVGHQQSLGVSIHRDELDTFEAGIDHAVDGITAAAANANNFDHGEIILWCCHQDPPVCRANLNLLLRVLLGES